MKIETLYPEICDLYGDAMNVRYLSLALPDAEIISTPTKSAPAFIGGGVDLVYIGSMTESAQETAIAALSPHRDAIAARIADGGAFLATGNAAELFLDCIENEDNTRVPALGIFDGYARRRRPARSNSLYLGKYGDIDIVGFNSRFCHMYSGAEPLFTTVRGLGRNPDTSDEGLRRNNFMATYLLGPLLVLNPPFTRELLRVIGAEDARVPHEDAANRAYEIRLREFSDGARGVVYSE